MAEILLTGGTGLLGNHIARALIADGRSVRALVRSPERARPLLPTECELAAGDLVDPASIRGALDGCSVVYHAAGLPEQWLPDEDTFQRVNVQGTRHLVEASLRAGVRRFVYASTIDVFAWTPGLPFDESRLDPLPKPTPYERSKQDADRIVAAAVGHGLPAVFLHPSAIYGRGPAGSPGLNEFVRDLAAGKVPMLLPGGMPVVYGPDVARGHILAEQRAPVGERYILSESYWTLIEIARAVRELRPGAKVPRVMPLAVARAVAAAGELVARVTRKPPLIPRGQLHFLASGARPVADKARRELGWTTVPFREALPSVLESST
jgi:dihydroflavonol-4-reductase